MKNDRGWQLAAANQAPHSFAVNPWIYFFALVRVNPCNPWQVFIYVS